MLCRIGGRLGSIGASQCGVNVEIPPCMCRDSNLDPLSGLGTVWQSVIECNGKRELDCDTYK
jgi:hypothetical protein